MQNEKAQRTATDYAYDAFGRAIAQSGSLADSFRFRFSTKYYDAETGLYYYGYRFYCPSIMRWLNRDQIEEKSENNLYTHCHNQPIANVDVLIIITTKGGGDMGVETMTIKVVGFCVAIGFQLCGCCSSRMATSTQDSDVTKLVNHMEAIVTNERPGNIVMLKKEQFDWCTDDSGLIQVVRTYRVLRAFDETPREGDFLVDYSYLEGDSSRIWNDGRHFPHDEECAYFCVFDANEADAIATNSLVETKDPQGNHLPVRRVYYFPADVIGVPGFLFWELKEDYPAETYKSAYEILRKRRARHR